MALLVFGHGSTLFTNSYWFYGPWVGSLSGALIGAFIYDFMIFTGGESPVNYPLERTKRALKKSYTKKKHKMHLAGEERAFP
jgi:aquaglyceroporin related protein